MSGQALTFKNFQKSNINPSISDKSNHFNMTLYTGVYLIIPSKLRMYKSSNTRQIKGYMNHFKSILLGGLLAAASIAALSQNANAAEFKSEHDHLNRNTVAFNNSKLKLQHERQVREQRARELRERQAREQRARELRERQAREQRARELRERQARLHH